MLLLAGRLYWRSNVGKAIVATQVVFARTLARIWIIFVGWLSQVAGLITLWSSQVLSLSMSTPWLREHVWSQVWLTLVGSAHIWRLHRWVTRRLRKKGLLSLHIAGEVKSRIWSLLWGCRNDLLLVLRLGCRICQPRKACSASIYVRRILLSGKSWAYRLSDLHCRGRLNKVLWWGLSFSKLICWPILSLCHEIQLNWKSRSNEQTCLRDWRFTIYS